MKEAGIIKPIPFSTIESLPDIDEAGADCLLKQELDQCRKKVVVLDDDPTGVQTVHDVSVYTDWEPETFSDGFEEDSRMFFILTNSRGMTAPQTEEAHKKIADGIMKASRKYQKDFILISRSDSTLRGHYPLETEVLREELEAGGQPVFDGEIIYPFFKEGGRYTLNKVHYVKEGDWLVPAGMTEFAKDKSFGYVASDLTEWCEEKTYGKYPADGVVWISITDLRLQNPVGNRCVGSIVKGQCNHRPVWINTGFLRFFAGNGCTFCNDCHAHSCEMASYRGGIQPGKVYSRFRP